MSDQPTPRELAFRIIAAGLVETDDPGYRINTGFIPMSLAKPVTEQLGLIAGAAIIDLANQLGQDRRDLLHELEQRMDRVDHGKDDT